MEAVLSNALPCPECCHSATKVTDSRPRASHGETSVYRRRDCLACGHRFTTIESRRYMADRDDWPLIRKLMDLPKDKCDLIASLVEALA